MGQTLLGRPAGERGPTRGTALPVSRGSRPATIAPRHGYHRRGSTVRRHAPRYSPPTWARAGNPPGAARPNLPRRGEYDVRGSSPPLWAPDCLLERRAASARVFERRHHHQPSNPEAVSPTEWQPQVHNHVTARSIPKYRRTGRVHRSLPKRAFDTYSAKDNPSVSTVSWLKNGTSKSTPAKHAAQLARRRGGKPCVAINAGTSARARKREIVNDTNVSERQSRVK